MELLTVNEVMQELRVGRMTVHRLLKRGVFKSAFKINDGATSNWRIPKADVEKFKERGRMSPE